MNQTGDWRVELLRQFYAPPAPDGPCLASGASMSRNSLYFLVIVLLIALAAFAIYFYQQQSRPGIEVRVDDQGISIDGNN